MGALGAAWGCWGGGGRGRTGAAPGSEADGQSDSIALLQDVPPPEDPRPGRQEGAPPGPVLSAPSTRGSSCQQIWLWGSRAPGIAGPPWGAALGTPGSERGTHPHLAPPSKVHSSCQAARGEGWRPDGNPDRATPPGAPSAEGMSVLRAVGMAPTGKTMTWHSRAQPAGAVASGSRGALGPLCLLPALPRPPLPYLMLLRLQLGHGHHCRLLGTGMDRSVPLPATLRPLPRLPVRPVCRSLPLGGEVRAAAGTAGQGREAPPARKGGFLCSLPGKSGLGWALPDRTSCVCSPLIRGICQRTNRRLRGGRGAFEGGAWLGCRRGGGPGPPELLSLTLEQPETRLWMATA